MPARQLDMRAAPVVALLAIVTLGGCGDDDADPAFTGEPATETTTVAPAPAAAPEGAVDHSGEASVTVSVTDNRYGDQHIVVSVGTEVVWVNDGRNDHNVTPDAEGSFEAVTIADLTPGASAARVFDEPGVYPYHCTLHGAPGRSQFGTVVVV